jgi:pimeloyl-ACP methyl ester carboxylesterase
MVERRAMAKVASFRSPDLQRAYVAAYDDVLLSSPVTIAETDVETPYGMTHVLTAGEPGHPVLVALHGKALSSTMWLAHLETLTEGHRVFLVDTIGDMNKSRPSRVVRNRTEAVDWLDAVLDGLAITETAMVGYSYGAWLAATYGMARANRVNRLVLVSPAAVFLPARPAFVARAIYTHMVRPRRSVAERFIATTYTSETAARLPESSFGRVVEQYLIGVPGFRGSIGDARPTTYSKDDLSKLTMPVLFVVGADESVCDGPRSADVARERMPSARAEVIDDANHSIIADQRERLDDLLRAFLAS